MPGKVGIYRVIHKGYDSKDDLDRTQDNSLEYSFLKAYLIILHRKKKLIVAGNRNYKHTDRSISVQSSSKSHPLWIVDNPVCQEKDHRQKKGDHISEKER